MGAHSQTLLEETLSAVSDPARLDVVQRTGLLGMADDHLDRLARVASSAVGAPRAFVVLVTPGGQHMPGMVRRDQPANTDRHAPLDGSFCQFAVATGEPLVIPDSREDRLVRDMPPVRDGSVGSYAGVPLRTDGGQVLGTLCVVDIESRNWTTDQLELLEDLAALAAREVENRLHRDRDQQLLRVARATVQLVHPLSDAVTSLVELAEGQEHPLLQRYAALSRSRLQPVTAAVTELRELAAEPAEGRRASSVTDLRSVVDRAVRSARATTRSTMLAFEDPGRPLPVACDRTALGLSVSHVLITALHHAHETSEVAAGVEVEPARGSAGDGGATGPVVTFRVSAPGSRVPSGELARAVARFQQTTRGPSAGSGARSATVRMSGGAVTAEADRVSARSDAAGLTFVAWWPMHGEADARPVSG